MSADRKGDRNSKLEREDIYRDLLDFGPEPENAQEISTRINDRLVRLARTLKDISQRIDKLASRL